MTQFPAGARRFPLLTAAEEIELAKRIERGDMAAKERLISSNLRPVVSIARRSRSGSARRSSADWTTTRG